MIELLKPVEGDTVVLLRPRHLEYMANPISDPDAARKIEWLNLKDSSDDQSFPLPVELRFTPAVDGVVVLRDDAGREVRLPAVAGRAEVSNLYIGMQYEWYAEVAGERSATGHFATSPQPPRMLYVDGITNVRDIGGYRTKDGKLVRQGLFYRTSEMDTHVEITERGKQTLMEELGIKTDLDIRGVNREPCAPVLDETRVTWRNFPLAAYIDIFTPAQMELYREVFDLLADPATYPLMLHCWGGIDRTGCFVYILGGLLGVREDNLALDYEMSSFSRWNRRSRNHPQFLAFREALGAYGSDLQTASVGFLRACGVREETMAKIRGILLTDVSNAAKT